MQTAVMRNRNIGFSTALLGTILLGTGCWRIGEPTESQAFVTWAAYPETVRAGEMFSFEFGGPISPTACGRLDTATMTLTDTAIVLSAQRSTFSVVCANQRISFYEARATQIPKPGEYPIRTLGGTKLGTLIAAESGPFSAVYTQGEGTIRDVGSCWLFGPGWIGNQRVFGLSEIPPELREVGTTQIVYVRGQLRGFISCGTWGSRPRIRVDTAWVTNRHVGDLY